MEAQGFLVRSKSSSSWIIAIFLVGVRCFMCHPGLLSLLVNEQRSRQIRWVDGGLLDGEPAIANDLDYALEDDLIHVSETKAGRRLVDWYLRNLARVY